MANLSSRVSKFTSTHTRCSLLSPLRGRAPPLDAGHPICSCGRERIEAAREHTWQLARAMTCCCCPCCCRRCASVLSTGARLLYAKQRSASMFDSVRCPSPTQTDEAVRAVIVPQPHRHHRHHRHRRRRQLAASAPQRRPVLARAPGIPLGHLPPRLAPPSQLAPSRRSSR